MQEKPGNANVHENIALLQSNKAEYDSNNNEQSNNWL